jgi:hypothetical protein
MTEEKRDCTNCGNGIICACTAFNQWQPIAQEKPVEKIQMTEEQAYEICRIISGSNNWDEDLKRLKQAGYIRKSAVEEAEEMYKEWLNRIGDMSETVVMDKMYSAIQELKSEIARVKK